MHPKSVREGIPCPQHTPGVYTTPVASISAFVLDWDLIVVVQTAKNKASMTLLHMSLSFLPSYRRVKDFAKIVQIECNAKQKTKFFVFIAEMQPILSKDSANRVQCKTKDGKFP